MRKFILIVVAVVCMFALVGCGATEVDDSAARPQEQETQAYGVAGEDQVSELQIEDIVVGEGAEAVAGKTIVVNYTGTLTDGTQFDSSVGRAPFEFKLGAGQVIEGWDKGFDGMKVGGKRTLTIPPEMGYGATGAGGVIPPNATLIFDVELLDVK